MFRVRSILTNFYLAVFDLTVTAACYFALLLAEPPTGKSATWRDAFSAQPVLELGWVLGIWLALLLYFRMYHSRRMDSVLADFPVLAKVSFAGLLVLLALSQFIPLLRPTPFFALRFCVSSFLVLGVARVGARLALRELRRRGYNARHVLLVASPALGRRLTEKISQRADYGYRVLRCVEYTDPSDAGRDRLLETVRDELSASPINDVIVALPSEAGALTARLVDECEGRGVNVRLVPDLLPLIQTDTQVYDLGGIPLVNVRLYPTEFFGYVVLKRAFDVAVSLLVLTLLSPLVLLIALLLKLTSRGPVFFAQERLGLNGKKFLMLKFRTMEAGSNGDAETRWTVPNDPRVTPLGRWLRRSNLDELPQFLNVLKGDMSVVGPRPERPHFIERFRREIPEYMLRHYVKCGITGWAQVNGWRGDTSIRERLAHDLYYMRHWRMGLDLKILWLTVARSFFHPNAY